ncbi:MAG: DUF1727 domain-containing protein [Erysipelotrichaceae bacterium]|nr:DUF1727 domain-containing protein [Erysipelotrichaceae bacterium]
MFRKIRYILGLWACKIFTLIFEIGGNRRNEKPGSLALHLDPQFLEDVPKAKSILAITGTNGKTTTTSVISQMLKANDEKFSSNNWGPNRNQAYAWALADAVSFFNKPIADKTVLEMDELSINIILPQIKPNYLLLTNIGRDSMYDNGNPEIIIHSLTKAIEASPDLCLFLNGDDPLSCFIAPDNRRVYFGVADMKLDVPQSITNDFGVCPNCGAIPEYTYRNYRHIGQFHCPKCGLSSPKRDFVCTRYDSKTMSVREKDEEYTYPVISDTIYNIYNQTAIVAYFRTLGYAPERIAQLFTAVSLPKIREDHQKVGNIEVIRRNLKGQNASAAGSTLVSVIKDKSAKEIVMIPDELRDETGIETSGWIWDSDFQLLDDPTIKRIIVSGRRYLDHRVRLLCAGIDRDKLITFDDDERIASCLLTEGIERIYILYDTDGFSRGKKAMDDIVSYLKGLEK